VDNYLFILPPKEVSLVRDRPDFFNGYAGETRLLPVSADGGSSDEED
jgi:hypothetical protein